MILVAGNRSPKRFFTFEYSRHRIVISRGDWIELVIVATCARDGGCEKFTGRRVDLFIDQIHHEYLAVFLVLLFRTNREKAGRNQIFLTLSIGSGWQEITR